MSIFSLARGTSRKGAEPNAAHPSVDLRAIVDSLPVTSAANGMLQMAAGVDTQAEKVAAAVRAFLVSVRRI